MQKIFFTILAAILLLTIAGILIFHVFLGLTWIESVYFVITTITTVGYGDINLKDSSPYLMIFGNFLMVAGAVSMAVIFGIVTDFVLKSRLREFIRGRRLSMKKHVILCGLGNIGIRVLEQLSSLEEDVIVVEKDDTGRFINTVRNKKIPVIIGDIRHSDTLVQANVKDARCLIAISDDDLANLEAALNARAANENIHVVLRLFDQNLAEKVKSGFNIQNAFSTSSLSAPAFAMSAFHPSVISSVKIGEDLFLNIELQINDGSRLSSMTIAQLNKKHRISVLAHQNPSGVRRLHPPVSTELKFGDKLFLTAQPNVCKKLYEMNNC